VTDQPNFKKIILVYSFPQCQLSAFTVAN